MAYIKFIQPQKILIALIAIGASSSAAFTTLSMTSPLTAQASPELPDNGAPSSDQREGAATRGPCPRVDRRLTTLMPLVPSPSSGSQESPTSITASKLVLGKTANSHPSFWFYLPYTLTPKRSAEFMLQDEAGKEIYQSVIAGAENKPGVVGFELPSTAPSLEVGKRYRWFFTVYCGQEASVQVEGWVERVALDASVQRQLQQATPQQKIALYRQAGFWQEAITTLAQLRRQNPDDPALKTEWTKLLQSVGLEKIAPEPITAILTNTSATSPASSFVPNP